MTRLVLIWILVTGVATSALVGTPECPMATGAAVCCCAPASEPSEDAIGSPMCCSHACAPVETAPPASGATHVAQSPCVPDVPSERADAPPDVSNLLKVCLRACDLDRTAHDPPPVFLRNAVFLI